MSARKTIEVEKVRAGANAMLQKSVQEASEGRVAIALFLESVLMETGNYKGFHYTDGNDGQTDDTRRFYY